MKKLCFEMKSDEKALFEMKSDEKALFEMKSDEKALSDEELKSFVVDEGWIVRDKVVAKKKNQGLPLNPNGAHLCNSTIYKTCNSRFFET